MVRLNDIWNVLRAPMRGKLLILEAVWQLARARFDTTRPASHYTRFFGTLHGEATVPTPEQEALAADIGGLVARVARGMPFEARCLQQVLAVRRMLDRRGVPAVVYLGLDRTAMKAEDRIAHAWVKSGQRVVNGDIALERYAVVGVFS